ncbi:MAG: hypothetical protein KY429_12370 [Actinobacteria bacterium]|nr:hypothetical protein [Actinomycetota bacterium]
MKVCWAGTFDPGFGRNIRWAEYLETAGVETHLIRADLWSRDRTSAFRGQRLAILLRMTWLYPLFLVRLLLAPRPDVYLVSYPGLVRRFCGSSGGASQASSGGFDIFISLYTAVSDRRLERPGSPIARLIRLVDRHAIDEVFAKEELATCHTGDPSSLADSIDALLMNPGSRGRIARAGERRFRKDFDRAAQSMRLMSELSAVLSPRAQRTGVRK